MANKKDKGTASLYIAKQHQMLSTLYINTRGNFVFYSIRKLYVIYVIFANYQQLLFCQGAHKGVGRVIYNRVYCLESSHSLYLQLSFPRFMKLLYVLRSEGSMM